ncbi:unnamed protein product [Musa acuminata var. zebrina]
MAAVPILERLHLEERLLRTSADNWCIVNDGTNHLAIVICNKNAIPGLQPYPRPIYHGPANCMARCFMDLATSISVKMLDEIAGRPSTVFDQELKDACSSQCEDSRLLALIRITS